MAPEREKTPSELQLCGGKGSGVTAAFEVHPPFLTVAPCLNQAEEEDNEDLQMAS